MYLSLNVCILVLSYKCTPFFLVMTTPYNAKQCNAMKIQSNSTHLQYRHSISAHATRRGAVIDVTVVNSSYASQFLQVESVHPASFKAPNKKYRINAGEK